VKSLRPQTNRVRLQIQNWQGSGRKHWDLYRHLLNQQVLQDALELVIRNKGSSGIDDKTIESIKGHEQDFVKEIIEELRSGAYQPSAVRRVYIPKKDGTKRPLGIPTLKDRVVQRALVLLLEPIFESLFHDFSYGFRPNRKARECAWVAGKAAFTHRIVFDADIEKFFDHVNHRKMMGLLKKTIVDPRVHKIIWGFLKSGFQELGKPWQAMSWLVIFDLLAVRHLGRIKDFLDEYDSLDPMLYRILPILSGLPLLVHFTSCCWIGLGSGTVGPSAERIDTYIKAVYWSFTTLTTVGYGDISAKTNAQMLFACGVQLVGVCAFGYILSNIIGLINRADAAREHHMDNLERVDTYTRSHRISPELRGKIRAYFHYLWITNKGYQDRSLLESLPRQLQSEIFLHLNKNMFEEVSFLKNAEQDLIVDLMEQLQSRVALPGERIFRAGDEGDALYFIQSGEIQIGGANGEIFAHLHGGEFFGEMALISDRPRSASARAISYADLFVLTKESFDKVSQRYPKFRNSIAEIMKVRQVG
jgi:hypothetical protein